MQKPNFVQPLSSKYVVERISPLKFYRRIFSKPKVVYPETTLGAYFALDSNAYFIDKTGFILISENAEYLQKNIILQTL